MKTRNYGLDLFRVMCCVGVLCYHIVDDVLIMGSLSELIYFGASFCVPGFFLLSGFLMANMANDSMAYYLRKALAPREGVLSRFFYWIVFWTVVHFLMTGEVYNVFKQFLLGARSEGVLPVGWFLFTYAFIVAFLAYLLVNIYTKHPKLLVFFAVLWMIMLAAGFGGDIVVSKTQSLWLHLYVGYFVYGMALSHVTESFGLCRRISRLFIEGALLMLLTLCYYMAVCNANSWLPPHMYYGKWYYTMWLTLIFVACLEFCVKNKNAQLLLQKLSKNTMVVYMGHLPILLYITQQYPIPNIYVSLLFVSFMFIGLEVMAEVMKRIPLLAKMV